ncbi:MAG TPA: recombinase family protein [Symbiobacteriaceae bacterium]|nr:recombinase family protein [Symbiobacteriaceae bacterium]
MGESALFPSLQEVEKLLPGRHLLTSETTGRWTVVFARVSTADQVREGGSLAQQVESGIGTAAGHGKVVTAVYIDPGKSASKLSFDQRAGVRMLLDDVRSGLIDRIYLYKRDRVARQHGEWLHFWKTCSKNNVQILFTCPQEPPLGKGIYGKVQEAFMSLWAELESEQIRVRVRDSIISRFESGRWVGGVLPFGLTRNLDGIIVAHREEAPIVKEIFRLAHEQSLGASEIAKRLNETRPLSKRGLNWSRYTVNKILQNRVYCGYISLRTVVDEDEVPRSVQMERLSPELPVLVPEDIWQALAGARKERVRVEGVNPTRHNVGPNMLAGLLICGECGRPMAARHHQRRYRASDGTVTVYRHQAYYCRNAKAGNCGSRRGVAKDEIEEVIVRECYRQVTKVAPQRLHAIAQDFYRSEASTLKKAYADLKKSVARTDSAIMRNRAGFERAGSGEADFYQTRISELLMEREAQVKEVSRLKADLQVVQQARPVDHSLTVDWPSFLQRFQASPQDLRHAFLIHSIDRIEYFANERRLELALKCQVAV